MASELTQVSSHRAQPTLTRTPECTSTTTPSRGRGDTGSRRRSGRGATRGARPRTLGEASTTTSTDVCVPSIAPGRAIEGSGTRGATCVVWGSEGVGGLSNVHGPCKIQGPCVGTCRNKCSGEVCVHFLPLSYVRLFVSPVKGSHFSLCILYCALP